MALAAALSSSALMACSDSDGDNSATAGSGKSYRIVQVPTSITEFTVTVRTAAEKEAKKLGVEYSMQVPAAVDVAAQTATLNAVIASRPDAILLEPVDQDGMVPLVARAMQQGIKVVTYDSNIADESLPDSFVANDYVESGQHVAEELLELTGDKGTMLHLGLLPGIGFTQKLIRGWDSVMDTAPAGVTALPVEYTQGEPSKASSIMSATLSAHPDLAGAYVGVLTEQNGALNALRSADAVDKVKTVAWDATPDAVKNLKAGNFDVVVSVRAADYGTKMIQLAVDALEGKKVPKTVALPDCVITAETVDDPANQPCIYLPVP